MPTLFDQLNLLSNDKFKTLAHATKAVQILHYLIYGSSKTPEDLLIFNKVLCGLPIDTPIPQKIIITKKIKSECQSLLLSIIKQWSALKDTSTESFVHTFLKRNAILTRNNNHWLQKVEIRAIDLLLNNLAWNIHLIKLKWNDYLITTEW